MGSADSEDQLSIMVNEQGQETITKEIQTALRHTAVYGLTNILSRAVGFLMLPFYTDRKSVV